MKFTAGFISGVAAAIISILVLWAPDSPPSTENVAIKGGQGHLIGIEQSTPSATYPVTPIDQITLNCTTKFLSPEALHQITDAIRQP